MNNLTAINKIVQLQKVLEGSTALTTNMEEFTNHFFAPGIYLRTLFIPKGHVLIGAIHKDKIINILLKGKIAILTSKGENIIAKAPCIFIAEPGQKAGYAINDVWYASIFSNINNITDMSKLKKKHIVSTHKELEILS